jgi:hypothetical protein
MGPSMSSGALLCLPTKGGKLLNSPDRTAHETRTGGKIHRADLTVLVGVIFIDFEDECQCASIRQLRFCACLH